MSKTLHFCTLFDSNYLTRGLAMYLSLKDHCPDFVLYVITFDEKCYEILSKLNLPNLVIISLKEFEDPELLRIKSSRTQQEYCWTCSSSSILYCIKKYNLDMCTYIDADLLFFENPKIILNELESASILLTEHLLPEDGKKIELAGKYCVQFMTFKNNVDGLTALTWWRDRCLEWCFARVEDGKYGDQKYLDDWTTRFSGVHVLQNIGGGVAPWNMFRYNIINANDKLFVEEKKNRTKSPLVFYHFQSTKLYKIFGRVKAFYSFYNTDLNISGREIYKKYEREVYSALKNIYKIEPNFNLGFDEISDYVLFMLKKYYKDTRYLVVKRIKSVLQ